MCSVEPSTSGPFLSLSRAREASSRCVASGVVWSPTRTSSATTRTTCANSTIVGRIPRKPSSRRPAASREIVHLAVRVYASLRLMYKSCCAIRRTACLVTPPAHPMGGGSVMTVPSGSSDAEKAARQTRKPGTTGQNAERAASYNLYLSSVIADSRSPGARIVQHVIPRAARAVSCDG